RAKRRSRRATNMEQSFRRGVTSPACGGRRARGIGRRRGPRDPSGRAHAPPFGRCRADALARRVEAMPDALTPVFVGLRSGLHLLVVGLSAVVVVRALVVPAEAPVAVVGLTAAFLAVYSGGGVLRRAAGNA